MNTVVVILILLVVYLSIFSGAKRDVVEHLRVATDQDKAAAIQGFYKMLCEKGGYSWHEDPATRSWDCHHTEATCKANSYWPEVKAEDDSQGIARKYLYWDRMDNKCYLGYGAFRKKCEELKMRWNDADQTCHVTPEYCKSKLLMWKNNDCYDNPLSTIDEKIFGTTLGRAIYMGGIGGIVNAVNWSQSGAM